MANPFGLTKAILAEREARRRRRFRAGVYALLITAIVLIMAMLIEGCQTRRPGAATQSAMTRPDLRTPRQKTNPLPTPMASEAEAEASWVTPQSTSLPENVTLPSPATTSQTVITVPEPLPKANNHKTPARHTTGNYVVKSGDTLGHIARAHGTTVKALKTTNHLTRDRIFVGEKLKLPGAKPAKTGLVQN